MHKQTHVEEHRGVGEPSTRGGPAAQPPLNPNFSYAASPLKTAPPLVVWKGWPSLSGHHLVAITWWPAMHCRLSVAHGMAPCPIWLVSLSSWQETTFKDWKVTLLRAQV